MTIKPCFIVVEGLEGAGKTTAIEFIQHYLESKQLAVLVTREPGGTQLGEKLRYLIKDETLNEPLTDLSELLLLYAARVQLVAQVIKPALARGEWVISDRFELSTYAYQGQGRGLGKSTIDTLSSVCLANFKPDLILFLDLPPALGLQRIKNRSKLDRIEKESLDFFNEVQRGYHQTMQSMDNVRMVDASASLASVKSIIKQHLDHFLHHEHHSISS